MELWPSPSVFPKLQEPFAIDSSPALKRSSITSGVINQAFRWSGRSYFADAAWLMTDAQYGSFVSYHQNKLAYGNEWFLMSLPIDGTEELRAVRFQFGKFSFAYQTVNHMLVTAKLDIRDFSGMTKQDFDDLLDRVALTLADDTFVTLADGQKIYLHNKA